MQAREELAQISPPPSLELAESSVWESDSQPRTFESGPGHGPCFAEGWSSEESLERLLPGAPLSLAASAAGAR